MLEVSERTTLLQKFDSYAQFERELIKDYEAQATQWSGERQKERLTQIFDYVVGTDNVAPQVGGTLLRISENIQALNAAIEGSPSSVTPAFFSNLFSSFRSSPPNPAVGPVLVGQQISDLIAKKSLLENLKNVIHKGQICRGKIELQDEEDYERRNDENLIKRYAAIEAGDQSTLCVFDEVDLSDPVTLDLKKTRNFWPCSLL
jgi:hypothetical protein